METIKTLRTMHPLIHHMTNTVTMNDCANACLAVGTSPAMVPGIVEAPELAAVASALVLNIGTSIAQEIRAMHRAGKVAKKRGIPIVFDPVGAGAMPYRQKTVMRIMNRLHPQFVKGNAAEISFLAGHESAQRGVDSLEHAREEAVVKVARRWSCIATATDIIDIVSDGSRIWRIRGGSDMQGMVCGTGCMSASIQAAFAAVMPDDYAGAAVSACLVMKLAGEKAVSFLESGRIPGSGLSSFRWAFMDALSLMDDNDLDNAFQDGHIEVHDA